MCPPNSHLVKIRLLSFLGRYEIPEWFVRSESSLVLKLIPSAQQCWPEPARHRDRSKDLNKVYCNIFHGVIAAPTKNCCDFRVTNIQTFVITVSPNTEKWGILEPTTPPTQDPEYNTTIMNWTKFNSCLVKHALLRKFYPIILSGTHAFIYQSCQLKLSFWWVSVAKLERSCLVISIKELFLFLKIKFIVLLVQESMRRGTSIFRLSSVL